jgi:hypothetical protein
VSLLLPAFPAAVKDSSATGFSNVPAVVCVPATVASMLLLAYLQLLVILLLLLPNSFFS